ARAARLAALLERDRQIADLGGEKRAPVVPLRQRQPDDVGEVVDLPIEIRGLERGMANARDLDHGRLRRSVCEHYAAPRRAVNAAASSRPVRAAEPPC